MNKFKILNSSVAFMVLLVSLNSCTKESIVPTPFWKILQGNWQIQKDYTINGQNFELSEIEEKTVLSLFENVTDEDIEINIVRPSSAHRIGFDGKRFFYDERFETYKIDLYLKNSNSNFLIFRNSEGVYTEYDCNRPERFSNYVSDFMKVFTTQKQSLDDIYTIGYYNNVKYEYFEKYGNCSWGPRGVYKAWGWGSRGSITIETNIKGSANNLELSDFDFNTQVNYWARGDYSYPKVYTAFKIETISSSEIRVIYFPHYYQRTQNSEKIFDTVVFRFKKLNTSSTVIEIPPFDIKDYSTWREEFENYPNSKLKNGAFVSQAEGIDNKSLRIPNYNSYAEATYGDLLQKDKTLSFWIHPDQVNKPKQVIFSKYRNRYGPYILSLEGDKFTIELNDGNGNLQKVQSSRSISKGSWTHVCLKIDSNNYGTLYINGSKDSGGTLNNVDYDAAATALIGVTEADVLSGQFTSNFKGYIDELILFNKLLGDGEIYQLYKWHLTN